MRLSVLLPIILLAACSAPGGPYPSLEPRASEHIDPRVPVERPINDRPVTPALANRLAELVTAAHAGDADFQPAMARAEQLASAAGAAQSESWIAAQEALSAAIGARSPTARALGDIDALGADRLQGQGGLSPADLAAVQAAGAEVGALDRRQADRIDLVQRRLGI